MHAGPPIQGPQDQSTASKRLFWRRFLTKVLSLYGLLVGGTLNPNLLTHSVDLVFFSSTSLRNLTSTSYLSPRQKLPSPDFSSYIHFSSFKDTFFMRRVAFIITYNKNTLPLFLTSKDSLI